MLRTRKASGLSSPGSSRSSLGPRHARATGDDSVMVGSWLGNFRSHWWQCQCRFCVQVSALWKDRDESSRHFFLNAEEEYRAAQHRFFEMTMTTNDYPGILSALLRSRGHTHQQLRSATGLYGQRSEKGLHAVGLHCRLLAYWGTYVALPAVEASPRSGAEHAHELPLRPCRSPDLNHPVFSGEFRCVCSLLCCEPLDTPSG